MSQQPRVAPQAPEEDEQHAAKLREAEQLLQQDRHAEALDLLVQTGRQDLTSRVQEAYARFLADQGHYQEAYKQMRRALSR